MFILNILKIRQHIFFKKQYLNKNLASYSGWYEYQESSWR
jgi:hypothetical protein